MNSEQIIAKLKQYPVAAVGLVLTLVLAVVYYLRMPVLPELRDTFDNYEKQVEQINQNKKNSVDLDAHLKQANEIVSNIEKRLIDPDASIANSGYFLRLREESAINFGSGTVPKPSYFDVDDKKNKNDARATKVYAQMEYKLKLEGELAKVLDFIYRLKTGHHLFVVDSISISPEGQITDGDGNNNEENLAGATISVRVLAKSESGEKKT